MLLMGGIRSTLTADWVHERKIRIICRCLFAYHAFVFALQLSEALTEKKDAALVILELMKVAFISVACLKVVSIAFLKKPIATLRQFIYSSSIHSGDEPFDELEQRKFNRTIRRVIQVIFGLMTVDTFIMSIPNFSTNGMLELPHALTLAGECTSSILSVLLANLLAISVVPKYFSCTASVGTTLLGLRTKLRILSRRFKLISQQHFSCGERCFEHVNKEILEAVDQHVECWRHMQILKQLVGKTFFLVHYFSIFAVGALIYVCREMGMNSVTFVIVAGTFSFLLEYFLLCHLVELLQDEADSIGHHIFEICAQIPFNAKFRSEYVQLRTTLMIVWINTRNGVSVNCVGLFDITTSAFVALIDVAYSVLMFLIKLS
ncbi:uncharacterized protein LOC134284249 [Aedes albopictus]|uniref:Odorant receptor n=1 Tax=Aedes albopictus TaxID=7160 RepID=A0ABM1ZAE4_AEDAL